MDRPIFKAITANSMAESVKRADHRVIVTAPALREVTSAAIVAAHRRLGREKVVVIVDCDEEVFRLGYGDTQGLRTCLDAGCNVRQCAGLRIGVVICDNVAWVFSPTALYVQPEVHSDETPNAVELIGSDVARMVSHLLPLRDSVPDQSTLDSVAPEDNQREIGLSRLTQASLNRVESELVVAPPIPFDIARQVRVFQPYIQYVDIRLTGCAIQRRRVVIPKSVQGFAPSSEVEKRLRTTFELIDRTSKISSKPLERDLQKIRDDFTRSLGERWGRVILRSARLHFDHRIDQFQKCLDAYKRSLRRDLEKLLDQSLKQIVEYYRPRVKKTLPDSLRAQVLVVTNDSVDAWLRGQLGSYFPTVDELLVGMELQVQFRDVTYETLRDKRFGEALRKAFPLVGWEKPFNEFNAASERRDSGQCRADADK